MHALYFAEAITTGLNFHLSCRKHFALFSKCLENQIRLMLQFYSNRWVHSDMYVQAGENAKSPSHDDLPNEIWSYKQFLNCGSWLSENMANCCRLILYHMWTKANTRFPMVFDFA